MEPYYQFSVLYIICTSLNFLLVFLNIQIEYMVYIVLKYYCVLITNSHVLSIALYEFRQLYGSHTRCKYNTTDSTCHVYCSPSIPYFVGYYKPIKVQGTTFRENKHNEGQHNRRKDSGKSTGGERLGSDWNALPDAVVMSGSRQD